MIRLFWGGFFPHKNPRLRLRPLLPTWNPPPTRRPEAKELVPRPIFLAAPKRVVSAFMPWISWRLLGFWCENVMKYHEIIHAPRHCQTIKNSVDMSRSWMLNLVEEWDSWKVMLVYLSFSAEQQQLQPLLLIACSELLNMNSSFNDTHWDTKQYQISAQITVYLPRSLVLFIHSYILTYTHAILKSKHCL